MKILSITAQKPDSTGSGVYLTETVRGFAALGHQQAVIAGVYRDDRFSLPEGVVKYPVYFDTPELPFHIPGMSDEMPYPSTVYSQMDQDMYCRFRDAFADTLLRAISEFQPDLILCHHLYLLTSFVQELCGSILPVRGICHGTDLRQMQKNDKWQDYIKARISGLDRVFCLHNEQRQLAEKVYGLHQAQAKVVANGYNSRVFFDKGERAPHKDIRLVYAGKISEKKGVMTLLRTLPLLGWEKNDFSLLLAGGWGSEEQKQQAEALIAEGGYDVELAGCLDQHRLAEEFNRGDVFVLPSFYDGLPLVLAESMSCGMKVVCTDLPGIRPWMDEYVPGHGIRFVTPPRMVDIDTPLEEDLPRFRQELAAAIREAAAAPAGKPDLFAVSWEAVCRRMLED